MKHADGEPVGCRQHRPAPDYPCEKDYFQIEPGGTKRFTIEIYPYYKVEKGKLYLLEITYASSDGSKVFKGTFPYGLPSAEVGSQRVK